MHYEKAISQMLRDPEVVLNLWAYTGEGGHIFRIAGKAYAMDGDDAAKLSLLRALSVSDWLSTPWEKVPENFRLTGADGRVMSGVAHASMLSVPASHANLFGPLMEKLATGVPKQMRTVNGNYSEFRLELPDEPLVVTTVVMEYEDGRLEPMVAKR
jgi:hypothetical protein